MFSVLYRLYNHSWVSLSGSVSIMNIFEYALRHITLQVPAADRTTRPRFVFRGQVLVVEKIATEYFRGEGWWVIKGDDAHLFFPFRKLQEQFFLRCLRRLRGRTNVRVFSSASEKNRCSN